MIRCEGIGKRYQIGQAERYRTLRDTVTDTLTAPLRWLKKPADAEGPHSTARGSFWALRDVSLSVKQGEVVGIIGRNGAGKSTLLKVLSRITEPTEGSAEIRGRIASLLEVGTGFHPELTGRENIYLNGAILGMKRSEVAQKFDEIVAFAEVETFLDTPVKRYSSGMYVRLAFAVAAHLEPEVLIIDEVLAVGDVEFQKKCLGKMESVARGEGRTVLFVSHNIAAVEALCTSAVLLENGRVGLTGSTKEVVHRYLNRNPSQAAISLHDRADRQGSGSIRFMSVVPVGLDDRPVESIQSGSTVSLLISFENRLRRPANRLRVAIGIDNDLGQRVLLLDTSLVDGDIGQVNERGGVVRVVIPDFPLVPGRYSLTLWSSVNGTVADWVKNAVSVDVQGGDYYGTGQLPESGQGVLLAKHRFSYTADVP